MFLKLPLAAAAPPARSAGDAPAAFALRRGSLILFVASYVALAWFGQWLALAPGHGAAIFLPGGLILAVLLSSEARDWPRWLAVALVVEAAVEMGLYHTAPLEALVDALGHVLGAFAGAQLVRAWRGLPFQLDTLRDVQAFSAAALLVSPGCGLALNALFLVIRGGSVGDSTWLSYWTGNAAGMLVMASLLLMLRRQVPRLGSVPAAKWLEGALLLAALITALHFIFSNRLPAIHLSLPLILWAAVRFGMPGIMLVMTTFLIVIIRYSALGLGPFGAAPVGRVLLAQSFIAIACVSALWMVAILQQYQAAQQALRRARDELEQRVADRTFELARSEQRLRALLDGIPERAWLKDAEGRYIAVNRAREEGYGLPAARIIGKTIYDIRPRDVADRVTAEDRMVTAHGKLMRFERHSNTRGNWVEITKTPIFGADGRYAGQVGIWRDITVRKQAEQQAVEVSEQRYRTLVNATSQSVWVLDAEGNLASIIKSLMGETVANAGERHWLDFVHSEDRAGAAIVMQAAVVAKCAYEYEHRVMDKNGRCWDVITRAVPVLHADGSVREWIGTSMDVSGQKAAERAVRQSNQTLRRLAGRREEVLEAERARIAHNLHDGAAQSLNVVRLKIAALAQQTADDSSATALRALLALVDQVNQEIRSLEFELSPPVLRELGLIPALQWLSEEMQRSYGLCVTNSDDGEEKLLDQAHRASTFRAVRELLINVAKHARVSAAHVDTQRVDNTMVITVSDMGTGFSAAEAQKSRVAGLGLAIVSERIEFCGGQFRFDSTPGVGTVSTIIMPLSLPAVLDVEAEWL